MRSVTNAQHDNLDLQEERKTTRIPEDWRLIKLKNYLLHKPTYGINAPAVEYSEDLPTYLRITDIDEQGQFRAKKKSSVEDKDWRKYVLEEGDLVFARTGNTTGKSYLYNKKDGELVYAGFLIRIQPDKEKLLPEYLFHYAQTHHYWHWIQVMSARGGQPGVNSTEYGLLEFPLPPLPEQQKIAAILGTWDEAVQKCEQTIAALKIRNKGLAQQLLSGKKRLKGFEGEWEEYQFEDLLKKVKRPVDWNDDELYKLISVRRRSGGIFYRDALYGNQIKVKNLHTAKSGDFLFSKMQIVHGASAMVTEEFDDAKISGSYIAVRSKKPGLMNIEYLNWYSKLPFFYHQTFTSSYGVHIEKMTFDFKLFLKEKIHLPSVQEQAAIVNVLIEADRELQLYQQKLTTLKDQKKGLMQKLLTGEVRVKTTEN